VGKQREQGEKAMSSTLPKSVVSAAAVIVCAGALLSGVGKAAAEMNFKGKNVDVILGSASGGGTDGTSRLIGTYLEKYLPGNPGMRYRNIPGGHGAKGLNYFAIKSRPDGLTWAGGSSSHVDPEALRKNAVEYDPTKFRYFGGVSRGGSILFIRKDKLANLTDRSKPPVVVGVLDGNRSWEQMVTWGAELLNWNVRFVVGYPGTSFLLLAIRRGETGMMGTSNLSLLKDMFDTGDFVGVAQLGDNQDNGAIAQRGGFETIPTFPSLVKGKASGIAAEAFNFWIKLNDLDKWYALPPNTPMEAVDAYRAAWNKASKDPEFIKQGKLLFSEDFSPVSGEVIADIIENTVHPKKEIISYMEDVKVKHGLPAEALTDEELAALAKEKGLDKSGEAAIQSVLLAVGAGGKDVEFKAGSETRKVEVSSTRTKIQIAGKKAERADLKAGMNCSIEHFGGDKELNAIECK
jgi:tripartite-type tricarboxylate transporter receptor subunit TctC